MPSNFDDQLERLLHRYADSFRPTRDVFSEVKARIEANVNTRHAMRYGAMRFGGRRLTAFPLIATASIIVIVALFGALFLSLRGGAGHGPQACPPPVTPTRAPLAGMTLEVTRAYIGDDMMAIDYRATGSDTSPVASESFGVVFYVRDEQGQYVTNDGGGGGQLSHDSNGVVVTGRIWFPSFAQPEEAGVHTLVFGWRPLPFEKIRPNQGLEVAFQATAVRGAASYPQVTPVKASGLTLQLVDLSINRAPNPVLTPPVESVRLHLRLSGLPTAPACDTVIVNSFHSELMGGGVNGDRSTLTFPDGSPVAPAWANLTGRPYFVSGYPQPPYPTNGFIEVHPEDHGQIDMVAVFYAPHIPQDGALTFTLEQLRFAYEWVNSADGKPGKTHDYSYSGPWTLTIPLS